VINSLVRCWNEPAKCILHAKTPLEHCRFEFLLNFLSTDPTQMASTTVGILILNLISIIIFLSNFGHTLMIFSTPDEANKHLCGL